jgi:hypothetical protein
VRHYAGSTLDWLREALSRLLRDDWESGYVVYLLAVVGAAPSMVAAERRASEATGHAPRSFNGSAQTVGSSGVVGWTWSMESRGTGGTATVTCSLHGQTRSATTSFSIA